jgi:rhodanese-related sulfurtransferase
MSRDSHGIKHLTAKHLHSRMNAGDPIVLLDVREDFERSTCALPKSTNTIDLHIPMGQIPARLDEIRAAALTRPLVVYCHLGQRSMVVARWLIARGFDDVVNLDGGIDAWSEDVDPALPRY